MANKPKCSNCNDTGYTPQGETCRCPKGQQINRYGKRYNNAEKQKKGGGR